MTRANEDDMALIHMALSALLTVMRVTEVWWRLRGDNSALRRAQALAGAIRITRRKFFADTTYAEVHATEAIAVAEGLREAAKHCQEGQAALHARLIGGAETIERLCRTHEAVL